VVFQQLFLWPHLTLLDNIKLPHQLRNKHDQKIERRTSSDISDKTNEEPEQRRLEDLIELFDMKDFVNRYPNEASLGQRQRAALVRALILQPRYLLLDEITSSLDVEQIAIILSYLKRLSKKGIGILIITHLLNFAREAADKVIFVDSGQIIESGGREVLDSPKHERVKKFLSVIESAS
jgi:ABC-type polar amino acid transport system ATPase subunit